MYTTDRNVSFGVFPVYQVIASLSHMCYVVKILMKIHERNTPSLVHANKQETHKFTILTFNPPKLQTITNEIFSYLNFISSFQLSKKPPTFLFPQELWRSHLSIFPQITLY